MGSSIVRAPLSLACGALELRPSSGLAVTLWRWAALGTSEAAGLLGCEGEGAPLLEYTHDSL